MSERESRPGESGPSSVSEVKVVHTVATDDPALATAVMLAISGQDANAVDDIAKRYGLTEVEAADVFRAVVGYGKRPNACYMDARGRLLLAWPEMGRAPVGSRTTIGGLEVDPEAEKRVDAMMNRHMASWKTYPLVLGGDGSGFAPQVAPAEPCLALCDADRPGSLSEVWTTRPLAGVPFMTPGDSVVSEGSNGFEIEVRIPPGGLSGAEAATMDDRHNCQTCAHGGPFACNLLGSMRSEALTWRASNTTGDGCPGWEGKATGEGFQTPSAPAQPSPALFCGDGVDPLGRLGADGGFRIPRNVIKSMGLNPGDFVYVVPDGDRFVLATSDQMQAMLDGSTKTPTFEPAQPTPLPAMIAAAQSFILADTCLDATLYEKGAHDAAMTILRGDLSKGDPRVTLRGQVEEARQTAHALEAMLNGVAETLAKTVRDQKVIPKAE